MKAKTNTNKKSSARKKLIPAAGSLMISAAMLSTSTYAWFTMNKEVEVTGLKMQATASAGLEVSLGAFGDASDATKSVSVNTPGRDDISWKRAILVSDYYKEVGKLLPASSDDALDIFKVPAEKVYAGGHAVETDATVTAASEGDSATMTLQTYGSLTGSLATIGEGLDKPSTGTYSAAEETAAKGNYIDIPMWVRCANSTATDIYCTVTITDPVTTNGSDLVKAVRVAIIPVSEANVDSADCDVDYTSTTYAGDEQATITQLVSTANPNTYAARIFGLKATSNSSVMDAATNTDYPTYHNGKVINATGTYTPTGSTGVNLGMPATISEARGLGVNSVTPTKVFTIPAATSDNYARVGFVARVWLEGESIYCEDATANQDWNIDFHFSTSSEAITALTP